MTFIQSLSIQSGAFGNKATVTRDETHTNLRDECESGEKKKCGTNNFSNHADTHLKNPCSEKAIKER